MTLDGLLARGLPLFLVFTSQDCPACEVLLPRIAEWQREHADRLTTAVAVDRATHWLATGNGDLAHVVRRRRSPPLHCFRGRRDSERGADRSRRDDRQLGREW